MTIHAHPGNAVPDITVSPLYAQRLDRTVIPRTRLADVSLPATVAAAIVRDELLLDGNARLNCATFCSTYLEPELAALAAENLTKNIVNHDEYPASVEIERRCVAILGDLWHGTGQTVGTATTGSSEAILLSVLAARQRWRDKGRHATDAKPNLVYSTACHPCWDKACLYFDVEPRRLLVHQDRTTVNPAEAAAACDENTIGVVATLGYPATGRYDSVQAICAALEELERGGGPSVEVHVDGASGGFVAPFQDNVEPWDFALDRVSSINASGHKYGLANLGLGWVLWRDAAHLPDSLTFEVNLLGGEPVKTFSLTFSRSASPVIDQYATFVRLGRPGYRALVDQATETAGYLAAEIAARGFELWGDGTQLPVVAFRIPDDTGAKRTWTVQHLSAKMRENGWQVPTYSLPPAAEDITLARVVCRHGLTMDLAQRLLADLDNAMAELDQHEAPLPSLRHEPFHLA
jgi:glutamate decarboxylase